MIKLVKFVSVFTVLGFAVCGFSETIVGNGAVLVENEFVSSESEQIRVRILGEAAEVLCSAIGIQLSQKPNAYIESKGSYTCGKTRNGQAFAGHLVLPSGVTADLESEGYQ